MIIQHNLPAMNAYRNLTVRSAAAAKNLERLSSGYRINRAADDAAGLAISEKMRGQIRGLGMAIQNAQNGISLLQTAEGGLNEIHAILQRMRELAVQSANGTYKDEVDRENLQKEIAALKDEIGRISSSTHYNGIKLLDGTAGGISGKLDNNVVVFGENRLLTDLLPLAGDNLRITDAEILSDAGIDAEVTISTKIIDGSTVTSVQIGDKSYTTKITDNNGPDEGALYDANGRRVGTINLGAEESVISGLRLTATGEIDTSRIADGAMYASKDTKLKLQIGANGSADQRVGVHIGSMSPGLIGGESGVISNISISTRDASREAIKVLDSAINMVSAQRASIGAMINRLEHTISNLEVQRQNLQDAESKIRDADMAQEMMEYTKNTILIQAAQAMLAQANQLPQGILQMLRQ